MAVTAIPIDYVEPAQIPSSRSGSVTVRTGDDIHRPTQVPRLLPYTPSEEFVSVTGVSPQLYDTFRHYMARREGASYAEPYNKWGYGAQYGFNDEDINKTAKRLGVPAPSKEAFLHEPELQDRFFEDYTLQNHKALMKNKVYAEATPEQRLAYLAGAHLSNPASVERYLSGAANSDVRDGLGTPISSYINGMARTLKTGVFEAPGWTPSGRAVASEQGRSNTDVVNMNPEEYLSLLPPIPDDDSARAKRANLRKSLASGDEIEVIPALEVQPTRDGKLKILDHDGRNRAELAASGDLDEIPVAIRGAAPGASYSELVGKTTIPYTFSKLPESKPAVVPIPQQQTQQPVIPPGIPGPGLAPGRIPGTAPPPGPMPPTKPDFYPQIAAGLNKSQLTPAAEPYRGLSVPNPADNLTASDRIANANATSAGQIGLTPNAPQNALSSLFSALNPIGSAQAAEFAQAPIPPISAPASFPRRITARPVDEDAGTGRITAIPAQPTPPNAFMGGVVAPAANFLSPIVTSLPADARALGLMMRGDIPPTMAAFTKAAQNAIATTQLPETPTGQAISNLLATPNRLFGWAGEKVLGEENWAAVSPYIRLAGDIAGPLSLGSGRVAGVLSAPARPLLNRVLATPEIEAARAINKLAPKELQASEAAPGAMAQQLAEARAAGIPLTPADLLALGGPEAKLLSRSLEQSPQAAAKARQFLKERTEGVRPTPAEEPIGGTLDRMTSATERDFGSGSAQRVDSQLQNNIHATKPLLKDAKDNLSETESALNDLTKRLRELHSGAGASATRKAISADPDIIRLRLDARRQRAEVKKHEDSLLRDNNAREGLTLGRNIFAPNVRAETISDFLRTAGAPIRDYVKLGASDAIRDQLQRVRTLGTEAERVRAPQNIRNKLTEVLGSKAARDYMRGVDLESTVARGSRNWLRDISGEDRIAQRQHAALRRTAESAGHLGLGMITGHHWLSPLYWGVHGARNLADYMASGGRLIPRTTREQAIANALLDPNAAIATSGRGLLEIPALPPNRQAAINRVRRVLPAANYLSALPPPEPEQGWEP